MHYSTLIKEYVVTDRRGCLVKEHLVRERLKPAEPSSYSAFVFKQHNQETRFYTVNYTGLVLAKLKQKNFFRPLMLRVNKRETGRETERGMQTYSMSDNKVSPSQERCWLSNRVQLLETKVTALWL